MKTIEEIREESIPQRLANRKKLELEKRTKWRANNKDKINAYNWSYVTRYNNLLTKCKRRKKEVNITFLQFTDILEKGCHYCGDELKKTGGYSLDRRDPKGGYTLDNVLPCCAECNFIKNHHLTVEETLVAVKAVRKYRMDRVGDVD